MLDVEPIKVGAAGQKVSDYWETAKKSFLGDPKFLTTLQNYDKDNIPPKIIDAIRPYMDNPGWNKASLYSTTSIVLSISRRIHSRQSQESICCGTGVMQVGSCPVHVQ